MSSTSDKIKEIHLLDYVLVIVKARKILIKNFFITVVAVIILSYLLPNKYLAQTTLMPPQEQEKFSMTSVLSDVSVPGISLPSQASSAEILLEILKSRTVSKRVLNRYYKYKSDSLQLYKILGFSNIDKALLNVNKFAGFTVSKQGIISVSAELSTPQLAADVANAFVKELDLVNQGKSVSRAKNSRVYIESQLEETKIKLHQATKKLAEFQQKYKAVSLEEQTRASIEQAGELKGQIIAKEVQLGVMRQTMKPENPLIVRAEKELEELYANYNDLQYPAASGGDNREFYLPFSEVPEVGLQLAELMRDVKVQQTVWELLNQQFYQAKIEEARDTPTVQVLDEAVPPVIKSAPKRKLLVIVFGLLSIIFTGFYIFIKEYMGGLSNRPQEKQQLDRILSEFKNDWLRIKNITAKRK